MRKRLLQQSIIGGVIIFLLMMVVSGHMNWMGAVLAGVLAFVRQNIGLIARYAPVITQFYRSHVSASQPPDTSTVSTRFIRMNLDHVTGKLSGHVLAGEFQGRSLDTLNQTECDRLLDWCIKNDNDSARLLESYIASRFRAHSGSSKQNRSTGVSSGDMTVEEALQVLGLNANPSKEEITRAYRKIMQQLHPDRGGNEYFAAKANQARDVLNKRFG